MKSGKTTLRAAIYNELYAARTMPSWWSLATGDEDPERESISLYSFADPIRKGLQEMGIKKSEHPDLYRKAAQFIGTEIVRDYDRDWWVRLAENKTYWADHVLIDDMRFQNEYDWCKKNDFLLVRLDISRELQYNRGAEEGTYDHPSETGLDHKPREAWDVWCSEDTSVDQRVQMVLDAVQKVSGSPTGSDTTLT